MIDIGNYFIRVMGNNRVFIKSNTTGRSESLGSIGEIPNFIVADIRNEVFIPSPASRVNYELDFEND